jgi:hypothetical protein
MSFDPCDPWAELDAAVLRVFKDGRARHVSAVKLDGVPRQQLLATVRGHKNTGRLTAVKGAPHTYQITAAGRAYLRRHDQKAKAA